jgi:hypothetical protein
VIAYFDSSRIVKWFFDEVFFSCFDRRLNHAAGKEGLAIHREVR